MRHGQTGQAWFTVDLYSTAAAGTHVTAPLGAGKADLIANHVEEQRMLVHCSTPWPAIDGQSQQLRLDRLALLGSVSHGGQDSITDMTVAQDTVMCFGIGVAANLGASGTGALRLEAQKIARNGFLASWLPFTTALLVAWPDWSWWYWSGVEDRVGLALVLGIGLEVGGFFAGRRLASGLSPPVIGRVLAAVALIYLCSLIVPWQWYSHVGTAEQFRADAAIPLWRHVPLLITLVVGGAWMFSILGLTVLKLWKMGTVSLSVLLCVSLSVVACGPSDSEVLRAHSVKRTSVQQNSPSVTKRPGHVVLAISHDAEAIVRGWSTARHHQLGVPMPELLVRDEGQAITALIDGRVEAAILHRLPNDAEERYSRGDGLVARTTLSSEPLARSAIVLIAHSENPIDSVPIDRAVDLLTGEARDWAQVGMFEGQVHLYAGERSASSFVAIEGMLQGVAVSERVQTMPSDRGVTRAVSSDPLGLGLGSSSSAGGVKTLAIVGTDDKKRMYLPEDVDDPDSMLYRNLYLVTRGALNANLVAFAEYARSKPGVAIAELNSYVVGQTQ